VSRNEFLIIVLVFALSVQVTRWLPFIIFRDASKLPPIIEYLGKVLPSAMMGLLVVYCYKDYDFTAAGQIVPAIVAGLLVAGVHLWKKNTVLSIAVGTAVYMVLIRLM